MIESEFKMKKVGVVRMKVALLPKETESSLFTVNFFQNVEKDITESRIALVSCLPNSSQI